MSLSLDEQKTLELLKFSLSAEGADDQYYYIGPVSGAPSLVEGVCLTYFDGHHSGFSSEINSKWKVFESERGEFSKMADHEVLFTAAKDFYCRIVGCPSPWDHRAEFERDGIVR